MSNPFGPMPVRKIDPPVEKSKFMRDFFELLRRHPFTTEELKEAYDIIRARMHWKTCTQCGKLTMDAEGRQYLGKELGATRFVCSECFKSLP